MQKFSFRLESVLKHRDSLVKAKQAEVEEATRAVVEAQQAVQRIIDEVSFEEEQVNRMQLGIVEPLALTRHLDYIRSLQERIAVGQDGILYLQNILAEKQHRLTEALKDLKVLENLKERQYTAWKEGVRRHETAALDEIATIRYVREREELK